MISKLEMLKNVAEKSIIWTCFDTPPPLRKHGLV